MLISITMLTIIIIIIIIIIDVIMLQEFLPPAGARTRFSKLTPIDRMI